MQTRTTRTIIAIVALIIVVIVGYLILRQLNVQPSQPPPQSDTSDAAAAQSLEVLRQLVTADNYQIMGFNSLEEVANAQLGQPLKLFRIQLDQLLTYAPESTDQPPVETLLVDVNRVMYPVTVNQEVRSSVAVEGVEGKWIGTDFGSPNLIKAMTQFRRGDDDFIVHIAFLGLYFVAESGEEGLVFTPITDDPRFDFKAGSAILATDVLATILPAARDYNGLPL
jgi:hypothetical protein